MANRIEPVQRYGGEVLRTRRPFWLPATNYYVLAAAAVVGVFFLAWGIMQDGGEASPWIAAGFISGAALGGAIVLREVFLRSARNRFRADQRRLDQSLSGLPLTVRSSERADKLTLEKNAAIIGEIRRKSDAAKVLGKFAEGHRDVVDLCLEYIAAVEAELPRVGAGSPRTAALRRGKDIAGKVHHFHLLQWAELESRTLTQEANAKAKSARRLGAAEKALGVVDYALHYYPHDADLLGSRAALTEFVDSIRLSQFIEKAERANFNGSHRRALKHYRDAVFFLDQRSSVSPDQQAIMKKIEDEIVRILRMVPDSGRRRPSRTKSIK